MDTIQPSTFTTNSIPTDISTLPNVNFNLPLPTSLETPRVKLVPFDPSIHAEPFFSVYSASPALEQYLPVSFPTYSTLLSFLENDILPNNEHVVFAIIVKPDHDASSQTPEYLAGLIGLLKSSPTNRTIEIGPIIILPRFQHTFVSSNAIGSLLTYLLSTPAEGGLGLRRVQWTAHPDNHASIKVAQRMGMKFEGISRWTWCLPLGKEGKEAGKGRGSARGRDSMVLAICWDDWEDGGKERVEELINRP